MGGAAQPAAAGMRCQIFEGEQKKATHLVRPLPLPCPFPSLPCAVSCCCRPPFVFGGAAGGWLRVGERVEWQVMVGDDDVAADGRRELWGRSWESGLREILNNDLKLTRAIFHFNKVKYYVLYVKIHIKSSRI